MKCEIIDGNLIVTPGTPTEVWAVNSWFESMSTWDRVNERVTIEQPLKPEPTPSADL